MKWIKVNGVSIYNSEDGKFKIMKGRGGYSVYSCKPMVNLGLERTLKEAKELVEKLR